MECSVIIVSFNTKRLTADCIQSILAQTVDVKYEIIVVDNGSEDGSQQEIKEKFPEVVLISSPVNLGFGKANNLAAKEAKGKYLFFLNSDTLLLNNAIKLFTDHFEQHIGSKLGCIGCNLLDHNLKINGNGGKFPRIKLLLKNRIKSLKAKVIRRGKAENFSSEVEYILGADMFMMRNIFEQVNGFDERFFMYFEESDLQLRIFKLGYRMELIDGPQIVHLEGKSTHNSIRKIMMVQESAFKYYYKNRPYPEYLMLRTISFLDAFALIIKPSYSFQDFITYFKFNIQLQLSK